MDLDLGVELGERGLPVALERSPEAPSHELDVLF
jgi:hypothetical protein